MRISDWSSDVCSSDLRHLRQSHNRRHQLLSSPSGSSRGPILPRHRTLPERPGACLGRGLPGQAHCCPVKRWASMKFEAWTLLGCCMRSEEHTSELQSLMRISYAVFCLKKKTTKMTQS